MSAPTSRERRAEKWFREECQRLTDGVRLPGLALADAIIGLLNERIEAHTKPIYQLMAEDREYTRRRLPNVAPAPAAPADAPDGELRRLVAECIPFLQRHNPQGALELADQIIALVRQHDAQQEMASRRGLSDRPAPVAQSEEWLADCIERAVATIGHSLEDEVIQACVREIDARYRKREAERLRELHGAAWAVVRRYDGRLGGSGDVILAEWKRLVNALAKVQP